MPVVVVAEHIKANDEALTRALILSHMMAIYIHDKLPKLSPSVPLLPPPWELPPVWLYSLTDFKSVSMAISNMIGDVAGMICDGASNSCAMKVSTSATAAFKAY
jgi:L-cysteine desulfidase